jgi:CTP:molybdopterin cytidylyltransferase MocA
VSPTVAVILANEPGSGFAASKYLTDIGGTALIDRVLADVANWPIDDAVVVLGPDAEEIVEAMAPTSATVVIDLEWNEGSAASLRVGLDVIERGPVADFVVIAMADQPGVDAADVAALIDAADGAAAVVPKYRYRRDFPVVLGRGVWERLLGSEGDIDLHDVLESHPDGVEEVWFDHLASPRIRDVEDAQNYRS